MNGWFWPTPAIQAFQGRMTAVDPYRPVALNMDIVDMDWVFNVGFATAVLHIVSTPILVADMATRHPECHRSIGGDKVFFSPFKQMDLLWWIITRQYAAKSNRSFHPYDLYLCNFSLCVMSFVTLAILTELL